MIGYKLPNGACRGLRQQHKRRVLLSCKLPWPQALGGMVGGSCLMSWDVVQGDSCSAKQWVRCQLVNTGPTGKTIERTFSIFVFFFNHLILSVQVPLIDVTGSTNSLAFSTEVVTAPIHVSWTWCAAVLDSVHLYVLKKLCHEVQISDLSRRHGIFLTLEGSCNSDSSILKSEKQQKITVFSELDSISHQKGEMA